MLTLSSYSNSIAHLSPLNICIVSSYEPVAPFLSCDTLSSFVPLSPLFYINKFLSFLSHNEYARLLLHCLILF